MIGLVLNDLANGAFPLSGVSEIEAQINQVKQAIADTSAHREGRVQRRGECDKYIFKKGRNECKSKAQAEIDADDAKLKSLSAQLVQLSQQLIQARQAEAAKATNTTSSSTTSQTPSYSNGGSGSTNASFLGGNNLLMIGGVLGLLAVAAVAAKPSKKSSKK